MLMTLFTSSKRIGLWMFFLLFSLFTGFILAEIIAQVYVNQIAKKGKLMQPDSVLGWKHRPHLNRERFNSNGELWLIRTNASGYRTGASWAKHAARRILILGDSFVFGQGINVEDRFDTRLFEKHPDWSFMNLGVMGYGTDQEFIAGREYFDDLGAGDMLILFTYFNDYVDILRQKFAGRSRPWFSYNNGELIEHSPVIGLRDQLRDKSYILSKIFRVWERNLYNYTFEDVKQGLTLYKAIVLSETEKLSEKGISVVIVHHGEQILYNSKQLNRQLFQNIFTDLCATSNVNCVSLDKFLPMPPNEDIFLKDGHWNKYGHEIVANVLHEHLSKF